MGISFLPKSHLGKLSVYLIIIFLILMAIFFLLVSLGERGGETFFSNLKLAIPVSLAGISGILSFFLGIVSMMKDKERSISVILSTLVGAFILFWTLSEILFPH